MNAFFPKCLAFTLEFEGGWSNNPKDPGGATNLGVTLASYRRYVNPKGTISDLRNMTAQTAGTVYYKNYWTPIDGDGLEGGVDLLAFDIGVNMGVGRANEFLRQTGNLKGKARVTALDRARMGFWHHLRTWTIFGKGWCARENACLKLALSMAQT